MLFCVTVSRYNCTVFVCSYNAFYFICNDSFRHEQWTVWRLGSLQRSLAFLYFFPFPPFFLCSLAHFLKSPFCHLPLHLLALSQQLLRIIRSLSFPQVGTPHASNLTVSLEAFVSFSELKITLSELTCQYWYIMGTGNPLAIFRSNTGSRAGSQWANRSWMLCSLPLTSCTYACCGWWKPVAMEYRLPWCTL